MNPIKAKVFIKDTAERLGFDEDQVRKVIELYYKERRKSLTEMENHYLGLDGIGIFYIKENKCRINELRYTDMLKAIEARPDSLRKEIIIRNLKEQIDRISRVRKRMADQTLIKREIRNKRKQYADDQRNMAK